MLIAFIGISHWTINFDNNVSAKQVPKQHTSSKHGLQQREDILSQSGR
jgi:hypothetical protein